MKGTKAPCSVTVSLIGVIIGLLLIGCSTELIAPYNQAVVDEVMAYHGDVEMILSSIERHGGTPESEYPQFVEIYDILFVRLSNLELLLSVLPNTGLTLGQLDNLRENLILLEEMHQEGISSVEIPVIRTALDVACGAIITLEFEKLE